MLFEVSRTYPFGQVGLPIKTLFHLACVLSELLLFRDLMDRLLFGTYTHSVVICLRFVPYVYVLVVSNVIIDVDAELGDSV